MTDLIDTTEMYLRTIIELEEENIVPLRARISERLGHSGPTVSQTVARMERDGLVTVTGDRHLILTGEGRTLGIHVMRKHRIAERRELCEAQRLRTTRRINARRIQRTDGVAAHVGRRSDGVLLHGVVGEAVEPGLSVPLAHRGAVALEERAHGVGAKTLSARLKELESRGIRCKSGERRGEKSDKE